MASHRLIYFKKVSKIYPHDSVALKDVSFEIEPHEFVSLVGRSGAGKSTILKLLIAEERPTSGSIFFENQDIGFLAFHQISKLRRRIGVVFQDFKLLPSKNVYENVAFVLEVMGAESKQIKEDVPQVLKLVGLEKKLYNFPSELSGGEKQRAALARALVHRPEVLVADEPTGNLDYVHTWDIVNLLIKINSLGTNVVLATHDKEIVNKLKRRVITLEEGRLISDEKKGKYLI